MGLYSRYILPRVIHLACRAEPNMRQREKVVPLAKGTVLEVGIGSGLNLPYYDARNVTKVWGLDPSDELLAMAEKAAREVAFEVEFVAQDATQIPLGDNTVDTVVMTYTLCSIGETARALRAMTRVLKPGGELIFCEHGAAPDPSVRWWQDRLTPVWKRLGGGCHLNRPIPALIEQGGFKIQRMETMYLPGWRPATFNYWGVAVHGSLNE
ncbi:MAG: class I SAM-dependent methyltransferase [Candidatus Hydrogenedentes bacterium]|nr:class I SAM-dependent methyltransferase [Candidatus Hydrogenedentota bacterium]